MSDNVIEFPSDIGGMINSIVKMYREGAFKEMIVYMPSTREDGGYHYHSSDGITQMDLIVCAHQANAEALMITLAEEEAG